MKKLIRDMSDEEIDKLAEEVYNVYSEIRDNAVDRFVRDYIDNKIDINSPNITEKIVSYIITEYIYYNGADIDKYADRLLGTIIGRLISGHELNVELNTTVLELREFASNECINFLVKSIDKLRGGGRGV